jgi:NAD(P)-dependent dehydrogenase (short-subunit alcohol dehydrogenase family)
MRALRSVVSNSNASEPFQCTKRTRGIATFYRNPRARCLYFPLRPVPTVRHPTNMAEKTVALITGANKGLGFEIARQLGAKGLTVELGARDEAKAKAAADELRAEGFDAHPVRLDVTNAADIARLPNFFEQKFGRLDVLVNNAGIAPEQNGGSRLENLRKTYETNVFGAFAVTEALLPLIKASPAGRIVNQSSILGSLATISSGQAGNWTTPGYTSSKAALNMLTVVAAYELKDTNIKVNAAHPGWVRTDMGGQQAPLDVTEGAKTAVELATLPGDGPTGAYIHLGKTLPW